MNRLHIPTKLESIQQEMPKSEEVNKKDSMSKSKPTQNKLHIKPHNLIVEDYVLCEQKRINKRTLPYEPTLYTVTQINGSTVTARRITDGRTMTRDGSNFKIANKLMKTLEDQDGLAHDLNQNTEDWREQVLIEANENSSNEEPPQMGTDTATQEVAEQPTTPIQPEQPIAPV